MHQKKYGKMTVSAWINLELEQSHPFLMLLIGMLLMIASITIRFFVGSPYRVILELGIESILPPVWVLSLLRTLSFLTVGCAAGFVLGHKNKLLCAEKYKGGMFFVLLAVLELLWYPTLFGASFVFLSVIESILILILSITVTVCFCHVSHFAGTILLFHDVWLIYLLILNFAILFHA